MSEVRRIPFSPSMAGDAWLELQDNQAFAFLSHLRSDNEALEQLRHALEADACDNASVSARPRPVEDARV